MGQAATARKSVARTPDSGPPKAGAWMARPNPPNTEFRRFYERSDLPLVLSHSSRKSALSWKVTALLCTCMSIPKLLSASNLCQRAS